MTLCFVWRTDDNVYFASDSRLTFGSNGCDAAIKVCRIPFNIYAPAFAGQNAPLITSGELGMAFAGSSVAALMTKEALAELVRDLQGAPNYHSLDMDGVADVMFRGFSVITREIGQALFGRVATSIVFAGYCISNQALRTFRMTINALNVLSIDEILLQVGDVEIFGSGTSAAEKLLPSSRTSNAIVQTLQSVIDDPSCPDVGGSIQYGHFNGTQFVTVGIAKINPDGAVGYWRGPLDMNGKDFDQVSGLFPRFPCIDRIK